MNIQLVHKCDGMFKLLIKVLYLDL